jgi:hypothetical protein
VSGVHEGAPLIYRREHTDLSGISAYARLLTIRYLYHANESLSPIYVIIKPALPDDLLELAEVGLARKLLRLDNDRRNRWMPLLPCG